MTKEMGHSPTMTAVQVALRIRPLTERDRAQPRFANLAHDDVLKLHESTVQVVPQNKLFTFDHVFGTTSSQEEIFSAVGENLIRKFVEGYNITILAYGQTSSGKTYTMGTAANGPNSHAKDEGIVPRSMALLFDLLYSNSNNGQNDSTRPLSPTTSVSSSTSSSTTSRLRPKSRIANRASHIPQSNSQQHVSNVQHKPRFTVKVSFIEIYNEDLHDLLNSAPAEELPPITIREDTKGTIYWTGVKEVLVHSTDDVLFYLEQGTQNRATGATDMNEKSSRSHAIFSVSLRQEKWMPTPATEKKRPTSSMSTTRSTTPTSANNSRLFAAAVNSPATDATEGEWLITTSKFHFVDLAGSERLKRTAAEGDRRKEGININAGLLALGNVISALGDPSKKSVHVPYRDSKLTRLLQDSLGGNATTLMIACASPTEYNLAETLNTLQYANRARNIKNKSEKNQVEEWMTTENIELLRSMIGKLKNQMKKLQQNQQTGSSNKTPSPVLNGNHGSEEDSVADDNSSTEETIYEQRLLISDLQKQLEEALDAHEQKINAEKELNRTRLLESMKNNNSNVDFQHLVEPVIEEYEKSVSKLESELALTKAALNHYTMTHEEQESKLGRLQASLDIVSKREHSNDTYIHELETKLMKSANDTTKDQEMLNELKSRIMKLKETDENTEQYIHDLEQRLATGEMEKASLRAANEELEAKIGAKERTNIELLKRLSKSVPSTVTAELNQATERCSHLENECKLLQKTVTQLEKENRRISGISIQNGNGQQQYIDPLSLADKENTTGVTEDGLSSSNKRRSITTTLRNRKSFADENEAAVSAAALSLQQADLRIQEETERANHLQLTLDRLQSDHQETVNELDEVLQRYQESLEQLEFLEREPSSFSPQKEDKSLDLSKEIAQAKEEAYMKELQDYKDKIAELNHRLEAISKQCTIKDLELETAKANIQKLEQDLDVANKKLGIFEQMEVDRKDTTEVEHLLENLNSHSPGQKPKTSPNSQYSPQDIEKLMQDLDGKESYISELRSELDSTKISYRKQHKELQDLLDASKQEATLLQKRLAETLASLTMLKITHEEFLKKQSEQSRTETLANQALLKKEIENHTFEKSKMLESHNQQMQHMNQEFETSTDNLKMEIEELEAEIQLSKELQQKHESEVQKLEDELMSLAELQESTVAEHTQSAGLLEQKIQDLKSEISLLSTENERLSSSNEKAVNDIQAEHEQLARDLYKKIQELEHKLLLLDEENKNSNNLNTQTIRENLSKHQEFVALLNSQIQDLESKLQEASSLVTSHQDTQTKHDQLVITAQDLESKLLLLKTENEKMANEHVNNINETQAKHELSTAELKNQIKDLESNLVLLNDKHQLSTSSYDELKHATEAQIYALEAELANAKEESSTIARPASPVTPSPTETGVITEKITALETQLIDVQTENKRVSSQLLETEQAHQHENDEKVSSLKLELGQKQQESKMLAESVIVLESKLLEAQRDSDEKVSGLKQKLEQRQQENKTLTESVSALESQLLEVKQAHQRDSDEKMSSFKLELEQKQQESKTLAESVIVLETKLLEAEQAHQRDSDEKVASLKLELEQKQQESRILAESVIALESHQRDNAEKVSSLGPKLEQKQQESKTLAESVIVLESKLLEAEQAHQRDSDEKMASLKLELGQKQQENKTLAESVIVLESKLLEAEQAHQHENGKKVSSFKLELEQKQQESKALAERVIILESNLLDAEAHTEKQVARVQDLEEHSRHSEQELIQLKSLLQQQEEETEQNKGEIQALEKTNRELQAESEKANKALNMELEQQTSAIETTDSDTTTKLKQEVDNLEKEIGRIQNENDEYTGLVGELEMEINRLLKEKEALADNLDFVQDNVNNIKEVLGLSAHDDDKILEKLEGMLVEIATAKSSNNISASSALGSFRMENDQSYVNNNHIIRSIDEPGALSQHHGPDMSKEQETLKNQIITLEHSLENCQSKMSSLELELNKEKQKLKAAEDSKNKLERQLEEALKKKSGLLCF